jgi:hypothetical protein
MNAIIDQPAAIARSIGCSSVDAFLLFGTHVVDFPRIAESRVKPRITRRVAYGSVTPRNHWVARAQLRRAGATQKKPFHPAGGESGLIQRWNNW